MKTLREQFNSETSFTKYLAENLDQLNKVNDQVNLPHVVTAIAEDNTIDGGRIDIVGKTERGEIIAYEHQDLTGKADQTHVSKTGTYATQLKLEGHKVLGSILLCESISEKYLAQFRSERKEYSRRKYNGHKNLHAVKTQFTDNGEYAPEKFEDTPALWSTEERMPLDHYKQFVNIYAKDWKIQREERNGDAVTLWHRISEMGNNHMAYIHTLPKSIKIGLHCEPNRVVTEDEKNFLKSVAPTGWKFRDSAKMKATIEKVFPIGTDPETLADATETLKRSIRKMVYSVDK